MNWTSPLAKDWIEREFNVIFAARSVRELMHRLGLSYTKPTYTLANADPQKQEIFKQEFAEVKKITSMRN
jgi:transposase